MYNLMSEEQQELTSMIRKMLEKELKPIVAECDKNGEFPMQVHDSLGDMGLHGLAIPEEYGGLGFDYETQYLIEEEIAKIDAGFAFTYCVGKATAGVTLQYGSEELKRKICDFLVNGGIGASCLTEPGAGSDLANIRTTAVKDGNDYILNGTKCFISNAPFAGMFQVLAITDKTKGSKGFSLFMIEKERGMQIGKVEDKMGLRLSPTSDVILEDVRVPAQNMIGEEGKGYKLALAQVGKARLMTSGAAVGLAQSALDYAVDYANNRVQFGAPIANNQGVSFKLADMEIAIQASRQLALYACRQHKANKDFVLTASCTKALAADTAMKAATEAVQILGGYGYSKEYPVEKLMRDAKIFQIFEGTNEIQRLIIGNTLTRAKR